MQSLPVVNEYDVEIAKIQDKIRLSRTVTEDKSELKKSDRSAALYTEYYQLRLDQCNSLKTQWERYQNDQKQHRQKDIDKRQIDFDKELQSLDTERRKKWKIEHEEGQKTVTYNELLSKLKSFNTTKEDGDDVAPPDTQVVTLPVEWLEYFWLLDIEVPITTTEIAQSIRIIEDRLTDRNTEE